MGIGLSLSHARVVAHPAPLFVSLRSYASSIRNDAMSTLPEKPKTEKELAKEKATAEKLAKFQAKQTAQHKAGGTKAAAHAAKKNATAVKVTSTSYIEETPKGQKKILKPLDDELCKAYNPGVVESAWYDWWEASGFLQPHYGEDGKKKSAGSFTIVIPPPNVTGALHCGHALGTALQDVLIRWHRMRGYTVLYLPGCDHASISTQSVVENMLWRREGKTRHDLGREKFLATVQDWKEEYHSRINSVLRRLGASLDWSREAFTMNPHFTKTVTQVFVQLQKEGFIYRAQRLVNWSTKMNTAISNLEVDNKELTGRTLLDVPGYERKVEFGVIVHFKYPLEGDGNETIEVATTRIETMLGDSGIAVHPADTRYNHLIGKRARHPLIEGRFLPIIADEYVDREFGTGALKLTPAHDQNDFDLGKKHNLEFINILNDDGTLNGNTGSFIGQKRFDARYTVVEALQKLNLFVKKADNPMRVPLCNKSKDIIEPLLKPQWYMRMKEMAAVALDAVEKGDIKIQPSSAVKSYRAWMSNVNDWCLSRQLWWGHQIPAYQIKIQTNGKTLDATQDDAWVTAASEAEALEEAVKRYPGEELTLERDPDVLDTWFSAGLWPFCTLGWPDKTQDMRELYPTNVLETGWDILPFWVARMVMFGLKLTNAVPFTEVYCHSLIRDSEGRKMSKSLGNVIDPVDVMDGIALQDLHNKLYTGNLDPKEIKNAEKYQKTAFPNGIPECGADALRFSLVQYTTGGGDIAFDVRVMAAYRRFCNKIYQATKYVLGKLPQDFTPNETDAPSGSESLAEKWIFHKLAMASRDIHQALSDREFSRSTQIVYSYLYDHLCDVYIENSKTIIQDGRPEERDSVLQTLYTALESGLKMIHPFMPFLSEELWQRLPRRPGDDTPSIMLSSYPKYQQEMECPTSAATYEVALGCSYGIRSLLSEYGIKEGGRVFIQALDDDSYAKASTQIGTIRASAGRGLAELEMLQPTDAKPKACSVYPVSNQALIFVHVLGRVDLHKELQKAEKKLTAAQKDAETARKSLDALQKAEASAAAVGNERKRLQDSQTEIKTLQDAIAQFRELAIEEGGTT